MDPAADPAEIPASKFLVLMGAADSVESFGSQDDTAPKEPTESGFIVRQIPAEPEDDHDTITPLGVLLKLVTSPRALVCIFSRFIYRRVEVI